MATTPTFDYADFYAPDTPITVTTDNGSTLNLVRVGESRLCQQDGDDCTGESCLRTPAQFREAFPDGNLPDDGQDGWEWVNNAWFEEAEDDLDLRGPEGNVWHTLSEAGQVTICDLCKNQAEVVTGQGPDGTAEWCWNCVHDGRTTD